MPQQEPMLPIVLAARADGPCSSAATSPVMEVRGSLDSISFKEAFQGVIKGS